jgi:hypothetical protein
MSDAFTEKYFLLTKNNRKTRFLVVARLHLWPSSGQLSIAALKCCNRISISKNQKKTGIKIFESSLNHVTKLCANGCQC